MVASDFSPFDLNPNLEKRHVNPGWTRDLSLFQWKKNPPGKTRASVWVNIRWIQSGWNFPVKKHIENLMICETTQLREVKLGKKKAKDGQSTTKSPEKKKVAFQPSFIFLSLAQPSSKSGTTKIKQRPNFLWHQNCQKNLTTTGVIFEGPLLWSNFKVVKSWQETTNIFHHQWWGAQTSRPTKTICIKHYILIDCYDILMAN